MMTGRAPRQPTFWGASVLLIAPLLGGWCPYGVAQARQEIPAQTQTGIIAVPARVMAGFCVKMVTPTYAHVADDSMKPSSVVLEAMVSRQGTVRPVRVVSGDPALINAAMDTVRLWRYKPYLLKGVPADVSTQVTVDFVPGRPGGLITHPTGD